jgi:hypothetical protein
VTLARRVRRPPVYDMVELSKEHDDAETLSALKNLEEECF